MGAALGAAVFGAAGFGAAVLSAAMFSGAELVGTAFVGVVLVEAAWGVGSDMALQFKAGGVVPRPRPRWGAARAPWPACGGL